MKVNNTPNGVILGSLEVKRSRIDAAYHLIFNMHHLFDLNLKKRHGLLDYDTLCLVSKIVGYIGCNFNRKV